MGLLVLLAEIAMLVYGLTAAFTGYYPGKGNRASGGVGARVAGVIMALPLPLALFIGLAVGAQSGGQPLHGVDRLDLGFKLLFVEIALIVICLVTAVFVAAFADNPFKVRRRKKRSSPWGYELKGPQKQKQKRGRFREETEPDEPLETLEAVEPLDADDHFTERPLTPAAARPPAGAPAPIRAARGPDEMTDDTEEPERVGVHPGVIIGIVCGGVGLVLLLVVLVLVTTGRPGPGEPPRAGPPPQPVGVARGPAAQVKAPPAPAPQVKEPPAPNPPVQAAPAPQVKAPLKEWGEVIDPDRDCQIKGNADQLTITVPGGSHDLGPARKNAPRILHEVEGDFAVQVKVTGDFNPGAVPAVAGTVAFNGAGLLVWENESNYLRLERNQWQRPNGPALQYPPLLEYWKNGRAAFTLRPTDKPFFQGRSTHLRLERRGQRIRASVSHDGVRWTAGHTLATAFGRRVKVGIDAVNTSREPFTVTFEALRVTVAPGAAAKPAAP